MSRQRTMLRARALRRAMTPPEARLWTRLRRDQLGAAFRKQHALDPCILDFYGAAAKLAVEVDGQGHDAPERLAHDARRDVFLRERGIRVLRFAAEDVRVNLDGVLDAIVLALKTDR